MRIDLSTFLPEKRSDLFLLLIPALIACYPIAFFFNHNSEFIQLSALRAPFLAAVVISMLVSVLMIFFLKSYAIGILVTGVNTASFVTYGVIYNTLKRLDFFQVEHYTLLPAIVILSLYVSWLIFTKGKRVNYLPIINIVLWVMTGLFIFNVGSGLAKQDLSFFQKANTNEAVLAQSSSSSKGYPDVYFLIFDELADTAIVREVFQKDAEIKQLEDQLAARDLHLVHNISSNTTSTVNEVASRLNLKRYDDKQIADYDFMLAEIHNAEIYKIFKQYGYTTAVYPGYYYLLKHTVNTPETGADLTITFNSKESGELAKQFLHLEVIPMLLDYTMLNPFIVTSAEVKTANTNNWRNFTLFALNEIPKLKSQIEGPRFLYAHIPSPHVPYVFDANGGVPKEICTRSAYCYYDQYVFIVKQISKLVDNIYAQYPPNNRPIIIILITGHFNK